MADARASDANIENGEHLLDTDSTATNATHGSRAASSSQLRSHIRPRRQNRHRPQHRLSSSSSDEDAHDCVRRTSSMDAIDSLPKLSRRRSSQPDVRAPLRWDRRRSSDTALTSKDIEQLRGLIAHDHRITPSRQSSSDSLTPTSLRRRSSIDMSTPQPLDESPSHSLITSWDKRYSMLSLDSANSSGTIKAPEPNDASFSSVAAGNSPLKAAAAAMPSNSSSSRAQGWADSRQSTMSRDSWDISSGMPSSSLPMSVPEITIQQSDSSPNPDGDDLTPTDRHGSYPFDSNSGSMANVVMVKLATDSAESSRRSSSADEDPYYSDESSCSSSSDRKPGLAVLRRRSTIAQATSPRDRWRALLNVAKALQVFKRTSYPWVQLAGHSGGFKADVDGQWILKLCSPIEQNVFEQLQAEHNLLPYVPQYQGVVHSDSKQYIKLENLVAHFPNPCVMDVKMGVRTFLEDDVNTEKLRMDLLNKMLDLDDREPTPEERKSGVTKMRYMQFRERMSSSYSLGFRIEAMQVQGQPNKGFKTLRARTDVVRHIGFYIGHSVARRESFVDRLQRLRTELAGSLWFRRVEIVGSSLLFVYSSTDTGVWMIDFAKTLNRDEDISHTVAWQPGCGSHEDGYLIGLDNLIECFRAVRCDRP
eukprot:TRINITY_DN6982_c0_g1_i1.p1 TRINITY_DN6982_c0_g1~~TRINITY_DN6982_c0_g1_i1.p1  ORF type:complete len:646 (+),score=121.73 TRINITY_DN6982_c0_g1_i1:200-2137(+)